MELLPTLRAQLEELEPHLDDPAVEEVLVAGPDRVFLTRGGRSERLALDLSERRVRALADRLLRALGGRPDRHEVRAGRLSDELEVSVIGTPRGERCPVLRVRRRPAYGGSLGELSQAGLLSEEIAADLSEAISARRSMVVAGPFGAPRERLLRALAAAWRADARVIALDAAGGPLAEGDVADLVFAPTTPAESLLAAAPDVIVAVDPGPSAWTGLLQAGRPTLVAVEAPDAPAALERLVALALSGDARLSRAAAEALVLAAVARVLELAPGRRLWLRRVMQPCLQAGRLTVAPHLEQAAPPAEPAPPEPRPAAEPAAAAKAPPRDASFAPAALVEALSNEIAEAEAALRAERGAPRGDAVEAPARADSMTLGGEERTRFASAAKVVVPDEPEEHTRFAGPGALEARPPTPHADPEPAEAGPDTAPLPPRRIASERMATVTGPPRPSEVRNQVAKVLDQIDVPEDDEDALEAAEAPSSPFGPGDPSDFEEELRTSHAVAPPDLDPFETQEASLTPSLMDSTQAAEIGEMLSGEVTADPRVRSVPAEATRARPRLDPDPDEWDEDAPSELIDRAEVEVSGGGPFEDEKTPVAPLFDKSPRASRRPRRRPRSAADGAREKAAEDLGDPTRRRAQDTPERPRAGRRRQRDRS